VRLRCTGSWENLNVLKKSRLEEKKKSSGVRDDGSR